MTEFVPAIPRSLIDALASLVAYVDKNETLRFTNLAFCRWFDLPVGGDGCAINRVFGGTQLAQIKAQLFAAFAGNCQTFSLTLQDRTGTPHSTRISLTPDRDEARGVIGVFFVAEDITELTTTQNIADSAVLQLKGVFEAMSDAVVVQDQNGKVISSNRAALAMLELTDDELLGRSPVDARWQAVHTDLTHWPSAEYPSSVALRTGRRQSDQIMGMILPSGKMRWLSVEAIPLFRAGEPRPHQAVVTFTDITKARAAHQRLDASERFLRSITGHIPSMVLYWSVDLTCRFANSACFEWFGRAPEAMLGLPFSDVFNKDGTALAVARMRRAIGGELQKFELALPKADGSMSHLWVHYVPEVDVDRVVGVVVLASDITLLKQAQEQLARDQARLVTASKMSALGEMAGGVAHEINNPLAIIDGKARRLLLQCATDATRSAIAVRDIQIIVDTVDRIAKIVRGLRTFSRSGDGDPMLPMAICKPIEDAVALCCEKFKFHGVDLRLQVDSGIYAECRAVEIAQVVMNLMINALDAASSLSEKWVLVEAYAEADAIIIAVTDSGKGIPADVAEKIMNPFFTTKPVGKGTGLGLSVSLGIIKNHNGELRYDANAAQTRFECRLPKRQPVVLSAAS